MSNNSINISFFGAPNSGKSTLFNALMDQHVAIISDKPQTTDRITSGILNIKDLSINLVDTPGISFIKNKGLRGVLNEISWDQFNNSEYKFFLVPANKPTIPDAYIEKTDQLVVIITKIDMIAKNKLPQVIEKINDLYNPKDILCVSAKYDKGVDYLLNYFLSLPYRKNLTAKELLDINQKQFFTGDDNKHVFFASDHHQLALDMTREAIFNTLKNEVPYYINIENHLWKEGPKGIHVTQILWVPNVHYRIILYSKQNLEHIKTQSRNRLGDLLNKDIFLNFIVKIHKKK